MATPPPEPPNIEDPAVPPPTFGNCCLCWSPFEELEPVAVSCGHVYCGACLNAYITSSRRIPHVDLPCPTCRRPMESTATRRIYLDTTGLVKLGDKLLEVDMERMRLTEELEVFRLALERSVESQLDAEGRIEQLESELRDNVDVMKDLDWELWVKKHDIAELEGELKRKKDEIDELDRDVGDVWEAFCDADRRAKKVEVEIKVQTWGGCRCATSEERAVVEMGVALEMVRDVQRVKDLEYFEGVLQGIYSDAEAMVALTRELEDTNKKLHNEAKAAKVTMKTLAKRNQHLRNELDRQKKQGRRVCAVQAFLFLVAATLFYSPTGMEGAITVASAVYISLFLGMCAGIMICSASDG